MHYEGAHNEEDIQHLIEEDVEAKCKFFWSDREEDAIKFNCETNQD